MSKPVTYEIDARFWFESRRSIDLFSYDPKTLSFYTELSELGKNVFTLAPIIGTAEKFGFEIVNDETGNSMIFMFIRKHKGYYEYLSIRTHNNVYYRCYIFED
jgi:hypothetical protein